MDSELSTTSSRDESAARGARESEAREHDAVYVKDRRGRYLMANGPARGLLGRDPADLIGNTDAEAFGERGESLHEADMAFMDRGGAEAVTSAEPAILEGAARTLRRTRTPLRDAAGELIGIVGVVSEDDEGGELERRLHQRETQLAEAEAIAQVGTWVWDIPSDEVTWSPQFYELLALSPGEVEATQEGFIALIHPDDQASARGALARALAGSDTYSVAHRLIRADGEERMVICRGRVDRDLDGTPLRMVGASLDLSDYMDAAETLRSRHDQLLAAEQLAGSGSFEYDTATDRVRWSAGLYRLFDIHRDEFDGTFKAYLQRVHPDDRGDRASELERLMRDGGVLESTHRIRRGDNSFIRIRSRVEVERGPDGAERLMGVCWAIADDQ